MCVLTPNDAGLLGSLGLLHSGRTGLKSQRHTSLDDIVP